MSKKENGLLERLQSMFKIEAEERLNVMSSGLLELEKTSTAERQTAIVETIFREAHSLKGAARAVNMTEIEAICQSLESVFAALKRKEISPSPKMFDTLHHAVDSIGNHLSSPEVGRAAISGLLQQLARLEKGGPEGCSRPEDCAPRAQEIVLPKPRETIKHKEEKLENVEEKGPGIHAPEAHAVRQGSQFVGDKPALSETVRISTAKLDSLLLQAEEMLSVKLAAGQRAADLRDIKVMLDQWEKEWSKIYPAVRIIRQLQEKKAKRSEQGQNDLQVAKLLEFIDWNHTHVKLLESKVKTLVKSAEHDHRSLGVNVGNLLEDMKKTLMLPFSSLLESFPKMVRDISRAQGKEVELVLQGSEVEIDKRILEWMKDPFIHLLRNCIDHGIEKPEERERIKKPRHGTVTVAISQANGSNVEILISDNGAGINLAKVKEASVKHGILSEKEVDRLSEQEALSLIFQSEVSTSPIITDISGRGLGLAIVREKVEKLGGHISVETKPQKGSSFRLLLPVTVATFRGILVRVADRVFVIPTANVERVMRIKLDDIKTVENRQTIPLNGRAVSFVRLNDVLELQQKEKKCEDSGLIQVLVLSAAEKRIAFNVDEVLNEQEVLVKSLGKQLSRVRNISGATVLGSGKVVPILNVPDLLKSAVKDTVAPARTAVTAGKIEVKRKSVLVVEDSITSRMLLKNIMESAGFYVKTAVDGVDALTTLRTEDFDLVVSDVEMPRMNGFDLTARIRADEKLSQLPVVLVTSLGSREDRERGIDVGANAYIVKSSFDHSNLLEIIRRLI